MMASALRFRSPAPRARLVTALAYGDVREDRGNDSSTVTSRCLRSHLRWLRREAHPVSTFRDLVAANRDGRRPAPAGRAVVLAFDHGFAGHADPVLPSLWEYRLPGEFFIHPAFVGGRGYLSWNELRGMASAGMSIQSHGFSHRRLDQLGDRDLFDELARSKATIEDRTGFRVTAVAAPGGYVDRRVSEAAFSLGYRVICGTSPGHWRPSMPRQVVPRFPVTGDVSETTLHAWFESRPIAMAMAQCRWLARRLFHPPRQLVHDNNRTARRGET